MRSALGGLVALSSVLGAAARNYNSSAYSDSASGIDFSRWCDASTGFCFGMALPETADTDFIGQLTVPLTDSKGWGGVSLSSSMTKALLIAAWPSGDSAVSTLRETSSYANPDEYDGDASIGEIADGTSINSTHLTYTFLCSNCIVGQPTTFDADASNYFMGWALSKSNPTTPAQSSSVLSYHAAGFGSFNMILSEAKSAKYSTWADKAEKPTSTSTSTSPSGSASPSSSPSPSVAPTVSNTTYDYIVVGGGPAGIITAERLAEAKKNVLLIERGGAPTVALGSKNGLSWNNSLTAYDVPAMGSSLSAQNLLGEYLCDDTAGMAGCVLGGGTIINALAFIHPQSADFDDKWPAGWKWNDVEAASKRLYERNPGSLLPSADGKRYDQAMYNVLSSFLKKVGYTSVDQHEQPNAKHNKYSYPSWSVANGIRAGPVRSYLPLAQDLDNFSLKLNTKVLRLVRRGGRVTGVEVQKEDGSAEIISVRAGGKVILAAGALSTPRVLFNSGIGPAEQIKTVQSGSSGVTVPDQAEWINLPVGKNLKDHPMFTITVDTKGNFTAFNASSIISGPDSADQKLYDAASGVLSQGGHRLQFWTSEKGTDGNTRFFQASCSTSSDGIITMKLYMTHGATSSGVLGISASGSTVLSTDPWLQTDADKDAITSFLSGLIDDIKKSSGGWEIQNYDTAADIIAQKTSGDHFVGTAKMGTDDGRKDDGTSVVDTNAKVYGTENLYIVDASIHPDLPTGNTQAIVMIAAEAAVAKILAQKDTAGSSVSVSAPAQQTAVASVSSTASAAATTAAEVVPTQSASGSGSSNSGSDSGSDSGAAAASTTEAPSSKTTAVVVKNGVKTVTSWDITTSVTTTTSLVVVTSTATVTVLPTFA